MSEQTLWRLARQMREMGNAWSPNDRANCYYLCAEKLEAWAREKSRISGGTPIDDYTRGWSQGIAHVVAMLGVPEGSE